MDLQTESPSTVRVGFQLCFYVFCSLLSKSFSGGSVRLHFDLQTYRHIESFVNVIETEPTNFEQLLVRAICNRHGVKFNVSGFTAAPNTGREKMRIKEFVEDGVDDDDKWAMCAAPFRLLRESRCKYLSMIHYLFDFGSLFIHGALGITLTITMYAFLKRFLLYYFFFYSHQSLSNPPTKLFSVNSLFFLFSKFPFGDAHGMKHPEKMRRV